MATRQVRRKKETTEDLDALVADYLLNRSTRERSAYHEDTYKRRFMVLLEETGDAPGRRAPSTPSQRACRLPLLQGAARPRRPRSPASAVCVGPRPASTRSARWPTSPSASCSTAARRRSR